jgi:hypothetical protein
MIWIYDRTPIYKENSLQELTLPLQNVKKWTATIFLSFKSSFLGISWVGHVSQEPQSRGSWYVGRLPSERSFGKLTCRFYIS